MSSFPSMISSEPPPLDSDDDEDLYEDEFRSNGLHLDISGEPSPIASPRKPPLRSTSNRHTLADSPLSIPSSQPEMTASLVNGDSISPDNQFEMKKAAMDYPVEEYLNLINAQEQPYVSNGQPTDPQSIPILTTDENVPQGGRERALEGTPCVDGCDASEKVVEDVEETTTEMEETEMDLPHFDATFDEQSQNHFEADIEEIGFSIEDDLKLKPPKEIHADAESESHHSIEDVSSPQREVEDDDAFGDFEASFANPREILQSKSEESIPDLFPRSSADAPFCSFPQERRSSESIEEVDFGHFGSNAHLDTFQGPPFPSGRGDPPLDDEMPSQSFEEEEDDFGDFAASESKECFIDARRQEEAPPAVAEPLSLFPGRYESLDARVKAVFRNPFPELSPPSVTTLLEPIDKELGKSSSNATWTHVQEFEDSHCLLHKWPRSSVHQLLLKSLNIDSSTILYSSKFGTIEVPKFASSLVDSPLQPQFSSMTQFDFLHRPTSAQSADLDEDPLPPHSDDERPTPNSQLGKEATKILEQLPDLSYMFAKTLVFPRDPKYD